MSAPLEFFVPGEPVAWSRASGGKTTKRFTPGKQRSAMNAIGILGRIYMRGREVLNVPLRLKVEATYPWPKSFTKRRRESPWKISAPDSSNILKLTEDALNTIVWTDDAIIADTRCIKKYGKLVGLLITVEVMDT